MTKKIKLQIIIILILATVLSINGLSFSENNSDNYFYEKEVLGFMKNYTDEFTVSECVSLYNFNDELNAYLFVSEKNGYVIISVQNNEITEFSLVQNSPFVNNVNKKDKIYYNGPLAFFKDKDKTKIINLNTFEEFNKKDLKDINGLAYDVKPESKQFNVLSSTFTLKISGTVPNYSYNPDGICGSTAAAMLVRWYDIYVNGSYVPLSLQSSDGVILIQYLVPLIDGSKPGSLPGELLSGLTTYLSQQGVNSTVNLELSDVSWIFSCVSNNKPYIIGLSNHPQYNNHWVTGYGYSNSGTSYFAIVNDGHGSREIYINTNYTDFILFQ